MILFFYNLALLAALVVGAPWWLWKMATTHKYRETELRENRDRLSQLAMEIDRAHARRRHNDERCAELLVRSASAEAELAQARHRLTSLEAERDSNPPRPD